MNIVLLIIYTLLAVAAAAYAIWGGRLAYRARNASYDSSESQNGIAGLFIAASATLVFALFSITAWAFWLTLVH